MTEALQVTVAAAQLTSLASTFRAMNLSMGGAVARAVNHTGDKAKTQMIRALTAQTGLKRKTIVKALRVVKASGVKGTTTYVIRSSGGNVSLKYFGARETPAGVSAAPLGKRQVFAGAFMRAGWWPNRVDKPNWHGQVFRRVNGVTKDGKQKFQKVRSGVFIPEEMITGASAAAFRQVAEIYLPSRLEHELLRAIAGAA